MSDWDDLFAAAAGDTGDTVEDVSAASITNNNVDDDGGNNDNNNNSKSSSLQPSRSPSTSLHKKKKRKKEKQKENMKHHNTSNSNNTKRKKKDLFQIFLESRMDSINSTSNSFPKWLKLGPSLYSIGKGKSKGSSSSGSGKHNKHNKRNSSYFCSGYKKSKSSPSSTSGNDNQNDNQNDNDNGNNDKCTNCSLSPLYHSSKSAYDDCFLNAFSFIRNIRCCCSCIYEIMSPTSSMSTSTNMNTNTNTNISNTSTTKMIMKKKKKICFEYTKTAKIEANHLFNGEGLALSRSSSSNSNNHNVPIGEKEILQNKFKNVYQSSDLLYRAMKKWCHDDDNNDDNNNNDNNSKNRNDHDKLFFSLYNIFDELINLIIECDAAYYRLYYLQVAGYITILGSCKEDMIHIPHPTHYFGINNLTWNVMRGKEWKRDIVEKAICISNIKKDSSKDSNNTNGNKSNIQQITSEQRKHILSPLGLMVQIDDVSTESNNEDNNTDPLSFLHENRYMEGLLIFWDTKWIESNQAYAQIKSSISHQSHSSSKMMTNSPEAFYDQHETIAPPILVQWRDSSRDLLCNLYGYATLSSSTIVQIKGVLKELTNVQSIVEMGAGTGYLACLLKNHGLDVHAFDSAPTVPTDITNSSSRQEINEYHGLTSPFYNVKKGDAKYLKYMLKQYKNADTNALLLCYPPPLTTMAEDMLSTFQSFGGKCVVHIGEFSGLTGSIKFQNMLKRDFVLLRRFACLLWGTDSAEVTIWLRNEARQQTLQQTLLLPCSKCHKKEALKQCRLCRSLRYCGIDCFNDHLCERSLHLALHNVPLASSNRQSFLSYKKARHFKTT
jgi:hypothetical protein